jgi:hypothetical protein
MLSSAILGVEGRLWRLPLCLVTGVENPIHYRNSSQAVPRLAIYHYRSLQHCGFRQAAPSRIGAKFLILHHRNGRSGEGQRRQEKPKSTAGRAPIRTQRTKLQTTLLSRIRSEKIWLSRKVFVSSIEVAQAYSCISKTAHQLQPV